MPAWVRVGHGTKQTLFFVRNFGFRCVRPLRMVFVFYLQSCGCGGGGYSCRHDRSRMAIDPRISTMPGRRRGRTDSSLALVIWPLTTHHTRKEGTVPTPNRDTSNNTWGGGGCGCTLYSISCMAVYSRMTIDPINCIPTMPGTRRSTSGFHRPGRHLLARLHQARSAVRRSARSSVYFMGE